MKLQIPINEAEALVRKKSGKVVTLNILDDRTLEVGYDLKVKVPIIGELSKNIVLNVTIDRLVEEKLHLSYFVSGAGMDLIMKGLFAALPTFSSTRLIESKGNNSLIINLAEIDQVHKVLQQIDVEDIAFNDNVAVVDFKVKA